MAIHSVLIDDEINNLENLRGLLTRYCPDVIIDGEARSADEGIELIHRHRPGLIFLDIQMPGRSGFELLQSLSVIDFEVIFVTAFDQYGIQAIKFSALDYLLKPVDIIELQRSVSKAVKKMELKQRDHNLENLMHYLQTTQESPRIALPTLAETFYVRVADIVRCEASDNYTRFSLENGELIMVSKTIKEYAELLKPWSFQRTHQSHLVNLRYVRSIAKDEGGTVLVLHDKQRIPVSRQNLETVKQALKDSFHIG